MTQAPLFAPNATAADADALCGWLRQRGTWAHAKEIATSLGWSDRQVRALSESAGPRIISGQAGYKLAELATVDELVHAGRWMISQGDKMRTKGNSYVWDTERHQPRSGVEIRFLPGRLKFGDSKNSAPFPSVVIVFRPVNQP